LKAYRGINICSHFKLHLVFSAVLYLKALDMLPEFDNMNHMLV